MNFIEGRYFTYDSASVISDRERIEKALVLIEPLEKKFEQMIQLESILRDKLIEKHY